ncbi:MAG: Lrp/AsnC family transcriptional regulator [Steroidobacteraceae bacterium]|jgi:Lrp/AsnC family transcriptional regulator|nr:Lrp/AsnC family transcriptional regulator [Steroidobacteraceae bacterium]
MPRTTLDPVDRKILQLLQRDAALSIEEIAEAVSISTTPCWRRIRRLESIGVIRARVALVEPRKINLGLTAFVAVRTNHHNEAWLEKFVGGVRGMPEVVELHRLSGDIDYLLKVVCPDMQRFDEIYKRLIKVAELSDVSSTFSMEVLKSTTELPLDYV